MLMDGEEPIKEDDEAEEDVMMIIGDEIYLISAMPWVRDYAISDDVFSMAIGPRLSNHLKATEECTITVIESK